MRPRRASAPKAAIRSMTVASSHVFTAAGWSADAEGGLDSTERVDLSEPFGNLAPMVPSPFLPQQHRRKQSGELPRSVSHG